MAQPYIGEIRIFSGTFAPAGWHFCDGALLNISDNQTLFNLIGTLYGGDGQTTFALPDLQGRVPIHTSSSHPLGNKGGDEQVALSADQMAKHSHIAIANNESATTSDPTNMTWATSFYNAYSYQQPDTALVATSPQGGNQAHDNMMQYLVINYIIALNGIYPGSN